jgi:Fanconi anemia group M protein
MTPKPFFDIFSKKPPRINTEKTEITADYREKNSLVISNLISLGINVKFMELKVADYLVGEVAIERKTISDFISSMINKRLLKQLEEIQQYPNRLLLIEGIEDKELYSDDNPGVNANAIRGFLLSILLKFKTPILFTKNAEDTARFIYVLSRKKDKETSLKAKKKNLNKKEQMQFILEGFPGIGPKTARKLLKELGSIKNILNTPLDELKKLIGKKAEIFKIIEDKY